MLLLFLLWDYVSLAPALIATAASPAVTSLAIADTVTISLLLLLKLMFLLFLFCCFCN